MGWFDFLRGKSPLDEFAELAVQKFRFLEERGFARTGVETSYRDVAVTYSRGEVRTVLYYELESKPWVVFEIRTGGRVREVGLHTLVANQQQLQRLTASVTLAGQLDVLAELTREHASGLLSGDTSGVEDARKVQARLARERNREMYGTSTGETPRFNGKPALPELFADAVNDDVRAARAYQAVWDYGYSIGELAEFLQTDDAGVQKMLSGWEDAD